MFIKMYSKCSNEYRAVEVRQAERKKDAYRMSKNGRISMKDFDAEEAFIKDREDLASLIIDWSGSSTPYSKEKAKELMTAQNMNPIALQVIEAFEDDENLY